MSYLRDRRGKKGAYQLLGNCCRMAERTKSEEISVPLCVCWAGESALGWVSRAVLWITWSSDHTTPSSCWLSPPPLSPPPLSPHFSSLVLLYFLFYLSILCNKKITLCFSPSFNENQKFLKFKQKATCNWRGKPLKIPGSLFLEVLKSCLDTVLRDVLRWSCFSSRRSSSAPSSEGHSVIPHTKWTEK